MGGSCSRVGGGPVCPASSPAATQQQQQDNNQNQQNTSKTSKRSRQTNSEPLLNTSIVPTNSNPPSKDKAVKASNASNLTPIPADHSRSPSPSPAPRPSARLLSALNDPDGEAVEGSLGSFRRVEGVGRVGCSSGSAPRDEQIITLTTSTTLTVSSMRKNTNTANNNTGTSKQNIVIKKRETGDKTKSSPSHAQSADPALTDASSPPVSPRPYSDAKNLSTTGPTILIRSKKGNVVSIDSDKVNANTHAAINSKKSNNISITISSSDERKELARQIQEMKARQEAREKELQSVDVVRVDRCGRSSSLPSSTSSPLSLQLSKLTEDKFREWEEQVKRDQALYDAKHESSRAAQLQRVDDERRKLRQASESPPATSTPITIISTTSTTTTTPSEADIKRLHDELNALIKATGKSDPSNADSQITLSPDEMIAKRASLVLLEARHSTASLLNSQSEQLVKDSALIADPTRKSSVIKQSQLIQQMAQVKAREEEIERRRQERLMEQAQAEKIMESAMQLIQQGSSTPAQNSATSHTQ